MLPSPDAIRAASRAAIADGSRDAIAAATLRMFEPAPRVVARAEEGAGRGSLARPLGGCA
jgi:hypothetical protein